MVSGIPEPRHVLLFIHNPSFLGAVVFGDSIYQ